MRLFSWTSNALKGHYPGQIIAMAVDADQARTHVRAAFDAQFSHVTGERSLDMRRRMEEDLAREPDSVDNGVVLIQGD